MFFNISLKNAYKIFYTGIKKKRIKSLVSHKTNYKYYSCEYGYNFMYVPEYITYPEFINGNQNLFNNTDCLLGYSFGF